MDLETLYTTPIQPDPGNAMHVLAFLTPNSCAEAREGVRDILHEAKRHALLEWYRRSQRLPS